MTAGVAYGFGPLDTRMSYSLVERETAVDTSLITVGSRLALRPGSSCKATWLMPTTRTATSPPPDG